MDHEARQLDPIVIIGAARSGTRILRGVLAAHPSLATVPYDINYVWMTGHYDRPDDELSAADATDRSCDFIRSFVQHFARPGQRVIEKTVGNALRVPFVDLVFPAATYIHLVRDGRDAAASARTGWQTPANIRSIAEKLPTFPYSKAWRYGLRYAADYLRLRLTSNRMARSWGPRYRGMAADAGVLDLVEICATQWIRSVESASAALAVHAPARTIAVRYESLVRNPHEEVDRILWFLGLTMVQEVEAICKTISDAHIGKWRSLLSAGDLERVLAIERRLLSHLGYL